MTEQGTTKKQFNNAELIMLDGSTCEVSQSSDREIIYVGDLSLDMREALALRDWLNKVLP